MFCEGREYLKLTRGNVSYLFQLLMCIMMRCTYIWSGFAKTTRYLAILSIEVAEAIYELIIMVQSNGSQQT